MTVFNNSRLSRSKVYSDENGNSFLSFNTSVLESRGDDLVYVYKDGDRLDKIAVAVYGNAQLKHVILRANPKYQHELEIQVGDSLNIPNPSRRDLV